MHNARTEKRSRMNFGEGRSPNWTYWRTGITNALKFIGDSFFEDSLPGRRTLKFKKKPSSVELEMDFEPQ
jgi:hypothetical protein